MNDEQAIEYISDKLEKKKRKNELWLDTRSFLRYMRNIQKGDWSIYVQEYEERYISNLNKKLKVEEQIIMEERRVLVRLSQDYQVVEVEVGGIDTTIDFEREKEWALSEARGILAQIPSSGTKATTPTNYQKQTKTNEQVSYKTGKVSLQDLTIGQGSAKQKEFLVDGINKGFFTLQEINAIEQYEQVSEYVSKFFSLNKKK